MLNEYDIAGTSYKAGSDSVAETSGAMANADVTPGKAAPTSLSLSDNSRTMTEPNLSGGSLAEDGLQPRYKTIA